MTASVQPWHNPLSGSSMDGIEEGLLDETDDTTQKFHETSTAFPRTTEHGWKEFVSDPSLSEVEISEKSKTQENDANAVIGHKDWDHYLSALSLNDGDSTKFMALEVHTDRGEDIKDFGISYRADVNESQKENFDEGKLSVLGVMEGMQSVTLCEVSNIAGKENIVATQGGLNQEMFKQESSSMNSSRVLEDASFPTISVGKQSLAPPKFAWSTKEYSPDGANLYGASNTVVRPGSAPMIEDSRMNSQPRLMSGTDMLATSGTTYGLEKTSKSIGRPNSVPLRTSVGVDWQPLIQMDEDPLISNANGHWQTEPILQPSSAPDIEANEMQPSVEERNILSTHVNVRDAMFTSSRNLSSINPGVSSNIGGRGGETKTLQRRPKSALDSHDAVTNTYFPKQSSSVLRANSAPIWQDTDTSRQSPSLGALTISPADFQTEKAPSHFDHTRHVQPKRATRMDDWESPLEQRKISGADEDMSDKTRSFTKTSSAVTRNPLGEKTLDEGQRRLVGNVSTNTHSVHISYSTSRANSSFVRQATGMNIEEPMVGKKNISVEDFLHFSGDGKHEKKSKDVVKGKFDSPSEPKVAGTELELERLLEDGNRHSIVGSGSEISSTNEERDSALLEDLRLNTNSTSSATAQQTLTMNRLDHTERRTESSNVATSREAAENLPVRPLTIGNSLTIGSTVAYQPISPFQADLYPTGAASSDPTVPSTTSVTTMYLSASQYSEGTLDAEEEGGDMSARERLQPLGRDGLEVKPGPPWGITMPLFQPDSRDSSLSSNDSNVSTSQFHQLQTTSTQQSKPEIEPLQSTSSTQSETDLSRKASIKSLEPKEPMGVKMMNGAGNLKTPIGKFHQLNPADGDSPVSKILGPTFKATQKMLEELQRMPLGAYNEDLDQPPVEKAETMTNKYESETSVERETVVTDRRPSSRSYIGRDAHEESSRVEESRSIEDGRRSQDSRHSNDSRVSREKNNQPTRDSYHEFSTNQRTPDLTPITTANLGDVTNTRSSGADELQRFQNSRPSSRGSEIEKPTRDSYHGDSINHRTPVLTPITTTHLGIMNNTRSSVGEYQNVQDSRPSSRGKEIEKPSRNTVHGFSKNQHSQELTPIKTTNIELAANTRSPVVSLKDGYPQRVVHDLRGSQSRRSERHKTSGLTDSTLGNSIGLSGHLVPTEIEADNEGTAIRNAEPESLKSQNLLENRNDVSDLSEFDRVASESISWSNALANQFREEMKSLDLEVQERLQDPKDEVTLVNPATATPILDSGLSESSTNDEIYRPKRLARLSAGNEPIGVYDVRQSSGPGSTNRKRLALGKKPRESSKSWLKEGIYVSDGTTGTSGTDRDSQRKSRQSRHRVHGGAYVSEGTTSGTEPVDNGIDSGPEGQSTPKSEDISARQSNSLTTSDFSPKESIKPITDMYLGLTNFEFDKPARASRSSFTTYEIEKPTRLSPSAFMNYKSEKSTRQDPPPFSTYDIDKPMRASPPGTSRNGSVTWGSADLNVTRLQPTAKVEHTWSISKPVMSQLSTGAAALVIHDFDRVPRSTTPQQPLEQRASHQPEQRRKRASRYKETLPKTVRQHAKDQSSESMESEKTPDKGGTAERKKSVADIILENMIQDEQERKKRHKKLEVKQEQTTQDLNQLWERFQEVFGKKSRSSRNSKTSRVVRSRPSRQSTPTDISLASSSDVPSGEKRNIGRQSVEISTDSDEEFERFLRRIREIQSSESSYVEDNGTTTSRPSSSNQRVMHDQSETTPSDRLHRKPRHKAVDSSTSMTSIVSSDDRRARRNGSQAPSHERPSHERPSHERPSHERPSHERPSHERPPRKAVHQNVDGPVVVSSSVTERKSAAPVSLPMWFSVKNKEMMKKGKTSSSCTCGAKSRKEKSNPSGVRDIGVNCPTPPIVAQDSLPMATDMAVLKARPLEEDISNPAPASLVKLSLQDAFMYSKQEFIERSRERVKKVNEIREERKNEKTSSARVVVVVPSEKTQPTKEIRKPDEDRMLDMKSKKQFEELQRKKARPMTTKEIRDVNKRMYKTLPEVRKKRHEERLAEFYKTNRLRAQLYGKHIRNTNRIFTAA